jgi:putative selenate reductase FAD-binding subunit
VIREYHRPKTVAEALALLARREITTLPLGGGTVINQARPAIFGSAAPNVEHLGLAGGSETEAIAVVDLQDLGLSVIKRRGNRLEIGATATLQSVLEWPGLLSALGEALQVEASVNVRRQATIAGTLVAADGRSPLACALLALDASLTVQPGDEQISLGDWLPFRSIHLKGRLITGLSLPLNTRLVYESVARTPADWPIVCAAVAQWPAGRTRLALGGYGAAPVLAMDGPEPGGAEIAARHAYNQAGDAWASAEYRQEIAVILVRRALASLPVS